MSFSSVGEIDPAILNTEFNLVPLTPYSGRVEIHRRLVGPLASTIMLHCLDLETESKGPEGQSWRTNLDRHLGTFRSQRTDPDEDHVSFNLIKRAMLDGTAELQGSLLIPTLSRFADYEDIESNDYVSPLQKKITRSAMYQRSMRDVLNEAFVTQNNITVNVFLPAYLSVLHNLTSPDQITDKALEIGRPGIADIILRDDFGANLLRMAVTASGLVKDFSGYYVDDKHPVFDPEMIINSMDNAEELVEFQPVDIYELFEKTQSGIIRPTQRSLAALKLYLNYRNNIRGEEMLMGGVHGPSAGCPVVQTGVKVNRHDYTLTQWQDMTGGDNPVAEYDSESGRLVFLRSPILELNRYFGELVRGPA